MFCASDLGLHCLPMCQKRGARLIWAMPLWNLHFKQNWKVILSSSILHKCFIYEPSHDKTNQMACAPSEDSDQPRHSPSLIRVFASSLFFMRTAKTLIRLGGCPGWSESALGAQSFCWFCHETFQLYNKSRFLLNLKGYWYYSFGLIFSFLIRQFFMVCNFVLPPLCHDIRAGAQKNQQTVRPSKTQIRLSYQSSPLHFIGS